MDNMYLDGLPYNEIIVALEDFTYGEYVKCSIPSLITTNVFKPSKKVKEIMNKNEQILGINKKTRRYDYLDMLIPKTYASNPTNPEPGKKGTKFIISFLGGGQQQFSVIGRVDE